MRAVIVGAMMLALSGASAVAQTSRSTAAQQQAARGDGLWFGGGLGTGWTHVGCDICEADRGRDFSGFLGVGGRFGSRVLIGAEASGWLHGGEDNDESLWGVSAVAYWFRATRRGLYWKTGVGLLSYRNDDGNDVLSSNAIGLQLGAGYAIPIRPRIALAPYVTLHWATLGSEVKFNGASILDHANLSLIQLGVGVLRR